MTLYRERTISLYGSTHGSYNMLQGRQGWLPSAAQPPQKYQAAQAQPLSWWWSPQPRPGRSKASWAAVTRRAAGGVLHPCCAAMWGGLSFKPLAATQVLASYGHVRDLPAKPGSVQPDQGFAMRWERARGAAARLAELRAAVGAAQKLVLATDPDREGEAISWHVVQELLVCAGPMHAGWHSCLWEDRPLQCGMTKHQQTPQCSCSPAFMGTCFGAACMCFPLLPATVAHWNMGQRQGASARLPEFQRCRLFRRRTRWGACALSASPSRR